jgi:hypothetical protein
MTNEPFHPEEAIAREKESSRRILLAVVCAVGLTALLLTGYAYSRRFHAQKVLANSTVPAPVSSGPKGPPLAHILVDEPMLDKGVTTIGGAVTNISDRPLTGLSIALELHRRKDGAVEQTLVPVEPAQLQSKQEGFYSIKLPAQKYGSIKLLGIKADPESSLIAYSTSPGKKRAPEKLEQKTIIVKRAVKPGEFLNTADNPTRVP